MKIIYSPRRSGKTTKLIEWLREDSGVRYLLTHSATEADRLKKEYPDLARCFVDWDTFRKSGSYAGGHSEVGIDNADMILQAMIHRPIIVASISETPEVNLLDVPHFPSKTMKKVNIIVNGKQHEVPSQPISYRQVIALTGVIGLVFRTVTFKGKSKLDNMPLVGTLSPDECVNVEEGMIFNVTNTSHA